jgi:hypothetical protein
LKPGEPYEGIFSFSGSQLFDEPSLKWFVGGNNMRVMSLDLNTAE